MSRFIEFCCTSVEDVQKAMAAGAGRVELCEDLSCGGVTPSRELIEKVLAISTVPVNVLVRPRGGDFVYTQEEEAQIKESIQLCKELKVNGVVIGALKSDGSVDKEMMHRLVAQARPLSITFHRAFDECSNPLQSLEEIMDMGCERLLTSGQKESAYDGRELLAELVKRAEGRIIIMPGGGVRPANILELEKVTHAREFHASVLNYLSNS